VRARKLVKIIDDLNLGILNEEKKENTTLFGYCRKCGSLGREEGYKFGEETVTFVCSNVKCVQKTLPDLPVLAGDDDTFYPQTLVTSWTEIKPKVLKDMESMGFSWNRLFYPSS
jgi:hypothetical protein